MKTVIVGGASISWIPIFTQDFCKCEEMRGATLVLHDINVPQMEFLQVFIEKVMEEKQHYFTVEIEPELDRALEGADIVICNVLVGGQQAWVKEIEYLRDMGIAHPKGMSVGPDDGAETDSVHALSVRKDGADLPERVAAELFEPDAVHHTGRTAVFKAESDRPVPRRHAFA